MQTVQRNIYCYSLLQTDVAPIAGTGGTASESTTIGNLFDDIIDIIDNGIGTVLQLFVQRCKYKRTYISRSQNAIDTNKAQVGKDTIDFINQTLVALNMIQVFVSRDLEILFEGAQNDVLTGPKLFSTTSR